MQPEEKDLFGDPVRGAAVDSVDLKRFRVSGKIIKLPFSIWKDGRMRVDVSSYGKGEVVSRNKLNLAKRVRELLANTLAETDELIAASEVDSRRRERNKRVERSSELSEAAGQLVFFRPSDYNGLFSNCPRAVDSMLGPTHLEKRLFGLAWAKAVYTKLDFYELSLSEAARELGATLFGIQKAAYSLRDRWRLFWFESVRRGRFGGAVIRFPWQEWMGSNPQHSCVFSPSIHNTVAVNSQHSYATPLVASPLDKKKEKRRDKRDTYNGPDWS